MINNTAVENKKTTRCQKCQGQLIRTDNEISCLQCGAPHTSEGRLAIYPAQEFNIIAGLIRNNPRKKSGRRRVRL